jgi:hypothetical protein
MVRTQLRLLANSQATRSTLISTIAQWLGFLGVHAQVTHLNASSDRINVTLTVGKPEACDTQDWQKIIENLQHLSEPDDSQPLTLITMTQQQRSKLQRLMAYVIQVGEPDQAIDWDTLSPQLKTLGFDEDIILGIRSATKIPQSLDSLTEALDADVAAIALPKAVSIALLDRKVNASEDKALSALLAAMKQSS